MFSQLIGTIPISDQEKIANVYETKYDSQLFFVSFIAVSISLFPVLMSTNEDGADKLVNMPICFIKSSNSLSNSNTIFDSRNLGDINQWKNIKYILVHTLGDGCGKVHHTVLEKNK